MGSISSIRSPATVCLAILLLAALQKQAQASILDDIGDAVSGAWNAFVDAVTGLAQYVECQATNLAEVDLEPCWEAPLSQLCTDSCRSNLEKLEGACLERLVEDVASQGDEATTQRLQEQIAACGLSTLAAPTAPPASPPPPPVDAAPAPVPQPGGSIPLVDPATAECAGVNLTAINFGLCEPIVSPSEPCSENCQAELAKLGAPCINRLATNLVLRGNATTTQALLTRFLTCNVTMVIRSASYIEAC